MADREEQIRKVVAELTALMDDLSFTVAVLSEDLAGNGSEEEEPE